MSFQEGDDGWVAALAGGVSGRFAVVIARRWVGAVVEKKPGEVDIADVGGLVQGCYAALLASVDIGTCLNQERGNAWLGTGERGVERSHLERIARRRVDLAIARQKQHNRFSAPEERRQAQRLEAVRRPGIDCQRIGVQELRDARDGAHGGRLVDSQGFRASFGQEVLGFIDAAVIERI